MMMCGPTGVGSAMSLSGVTVAIPQRKSSDAPACQSACRALLRHRHAALDGGAGAYQVVPAFQTRVFFDQVRVALQCYIDEGEDGNISDREFATDQILGLGKL